MEGRTDTYVLDEALSEGAPRADDDARVEVLHGPRDDLRRRGRPSVDEHRQRRLAGFADGLPVAAVQDAPEAAALRGDQVRPLWHEQRRHVHLHTRAHFEKYT